MEKSDETILRREASHLSVIGNFEHRRCLTKLRISAHRLHIETGRYQGIPPHQRLCEQCDSGEVEDEIHFLLCCSKFREERQQLFKTISQSCNNFLQLNPREKFYWLMTSCNNVAPVTNLCLGRATTRSHSSQWSKKKSCS